MPTVGLLTGRVQPVAAVCAAVVVAADDFSGGCAFGAVRVFGAEDADFFTDAPPLVVCVAFLPRASFRPGWISDGSLPMASRLSAYSFCQPPRTCCSTAILER
ncbi:hypothetical protein GCM10020256_07330 [Streptomyces thermocoprophilus]